MGLDGISANQLRITRDNTSKENAIQAEALAKIGEGSRSVNSLDKKGAIDTDDKENTSYFGGSSSNEEEGENDEQHSDEEFVSIQKFDLTNKENFEIKVEENSNSLTIYNKKTNNLVQKITPNELSSLVDNLKNPGGIIVNKRI